MHRIFCNSKDITRDKIIISDAGQIHHIRDVLRLKIGDEISVCDDKSNTYNSVIEKLTSKNIVFKMKDTKKAGSLQKIKITVACAIPKKSKFDDIVDKLTQLGVERIIPMQTERVIVKLDSRKEASRLERFRKIAQSASEQSKRNTLPVIEPVKDITEVLIGAGDFDLKLIPTLAGERKTLDEILRPAKGGAQNDRNDISQQYQNVLVLIGPEGDFTDEEVGLAKSRGFIPVTLGGLVLRVETAAVAITSILNYALKDEDL